MKINKENLYILYMEEVNRICNLEENEFKTNFHPREIVDIIATIIETTPPPLIWTK